MQPLPMNELVKEQLEAVGFEVTLDPIDWNALLGVYFGGAKNFPKYHGVNVSLSSIEPVQAIMKNSMTRYQPPNGLNWGFFSIRKQTLGEAALNEFDPEKRLKIIQQMHERLVDQAYEIFIAHDLNPRALSPKLKGFVQAQSWFQDLTPIEVVQ